MAKIEIKETEYHNCPYCYRTIPDYAICNCVGIYNQALEDLFNKTLDVISSDYSHPYLGDAIYGLVNDAMVDAIKQLKK